MTTSQDKIRHMLSQCTGSTIAAPCCRHGLFECFIRNIYSMLLQVKFHAVQRSADPSPHYIFQSVHCGRIHVAHALLLPGQRPRGGGPLPLTGLDLGECPSGHLAYSRAPSPTRTKRTPTHSILRRRGTPWTFTLRSPPANLAGLRQPSFFLLPTPPTSPAPPAAPRNPPFLLCLGFRHGFTPSPRAPNLRHLEREARGQGGRQPRAGGLLGHGRAGAVRVDAPLLLLRRARLHHGL
mmetsp:Transcript_82732/g.221841  ORF Transcript_82732/g.221841 Transcript_82732/m.221841 type:complete len:237 (+) Transcript_82732:161-871(+)